MSDIEDVKKFIFNDDIQHELLTINNNFMDLNILEITGMGSQEIRHSNILGWLFEDSAHGLEYKILEGFLKKAIEENYGNTDNRDVLNTLQSYIYLSNQKKDITVYRERDNIDLLLVDESNKVVITIENKVDAAQSEHQLKKYENKINEEYKSYVRYFIFLTKNLDDTYNAEEYWMKANHQMIAEVIDEILATQNIKQDISVKSQIILESYVDLLKRRKIVEDKNIQDLAIKIWKNPEYKKALDILYEYKPDTTLLVKSLIEEKLTKLMNVESVYSTKTYIRFADTRWDNIPHQMSGNQQWHKNIDRVLLYEFNNRAGSLTLDLIIGPATNAGYREYLYEYINEFITDVKKTSLKIKPKKRQSNKFTDWQRMMYFEILTKKDLEMETEDGIESKIDIFFNEFFPNQYNKVAELILNRCSKYE